MAEQLYKVLQRERYGFINGSQLMAAKFCTITVPEPRWDIPEGEWYCRTPECVVRECTIRCKTYGEPLPNEIWCPLCGESMEFKHWLDHETLVPANADV